MIRVFIADDHAMVRMGMRQVLHEIGGFEVIGEAANGREVLSSPLLDACDVLVLDLSMPRVEGTEVLRRLHARRPQLPIVVHSMYSEEQFARRSIAAGAVAYVSKEGPPTALVDAVLRAATTPRYDLMQEAEASSVGGGGAKHDQLTPREHQVFVRLVAGASVADIAAELDVHSCTVSNHFAKIRTKLGVHSVAELVRYAYAEGLLREEPR
jgi:DNA-binding NarL/FixJ family response regulator